jgi:hypothetical protein
MPAADCVPAAQLGLWAVPVPPRGPGVAEVRRTFDER